MINWGDGDWETILMHSTINGHPYAPRLIMDHGLVYADYYFVEFANEVLKMKFDAANGTKNGITSGHLNQSVSQPAIEASCGH